MPIPRLTETCQPPVVNGTARLTAAAFQGADLPALMRMIPAPCGPAALFDRSIAYQLAFRPQQARAVQQAALSASPLYRISGGGCGTRLLAICVPGDLMANTPLDFLTGASDIRLDLMFVTPDAPLPREVPDHDVAFFAATETDDPATNQLLRQLHAAWPRPVLNNPALLPTLRREVLHGALAGIQGVLSPPVVAVERAFLADFSADGLDQGLPGAAYPLLLRPAGSHAGRGFRRIDHPAAIADYLAANPEATHYMSRFVEYRSSDGQYRKYRIVLIDRTAYLHHLAISDHWMVHYLNAGMARSAAKRQEEADALAGFPHGLALRHACALAAIQSRLDLEYVVIDCAQMPDGRLLVFEADTAAIIHGLDPPDLFAYKRAPMDRIISAFHAMLARQDRRGRCSAVPHQMQPGQDQTNRHAAVKS